MAEEETTPDAKFKPGLFFKVFRENVYDIRQSISLKYTKSLSQSLIVLRFKMNARKIRA